jgi:hypothetical protein
VAALWRPADPRLWVAFFVHDLGHLVYNSPNMDGDAGERHVEWGAKVMAWLFDGVGRDGTPRPGVHYTGWVVLPGGFWLGHWGQFCLFHSRFTAKRAGRPFSPLCVADKLACALEPWWLYLPRVLASGEVWEYLALAGGKGNSKYKGEPNGKYVTMQLETGTLRGWHRGMTAYLREWVAEHADGRADTWTPTPGGAV